MAARYLLPCSCGREHPIEAYQAGQEIRCECGRQLEIPTLLGLRHLAREEAAPSPNAASHTWGIRQRVLLVGALTAALGGGLALGAFYTRPVRDDVTKYRPAWALSLWESLQQGVDVPPTKRELEVFGKIENHHRWTIVGLVVAVVGMLILGGSLLIGPQRGSRPHPRR